MISYNPIIQHLKTDFNYHLDILRLDLIDDEISGNKWFKLKYNIEKARSEGITTVLTFGGAFSNHIAATAAACKKYNLKSIGIIRGDETGELNGTLKRAKENGMHLHYLSRENYSKKNESEFQKNLEKIFGKYYLIPEGGNNLEGVLGSMEIIKDSMNYDYIVCACGTATSYAGVALSVKPRQTVVGISVLKGQNLLQLQTQQLLNEIFPERKMEISGNEELNKERIENNCISNAYCFKGFANYDKELIEFKMDFESEYDIPLDYLYTNKLLYAVFDLARGNKFKKDARILIVHSGGLQGNNGFEERYHLIPMR